MSSASLSDLPHAEQTDMRAVYDRILARGGFSTFEVEGPLRRTVTELFKIGLLASDREAAYPWTAAKETTKGKAWRHGGKVCPVCDGEEFAPVPIADRIAVLKRCATCAGTGIVSETQKD